MKMSKLQKLRAAMADKGFDAVIITSEVNQRYITGFNFQDGLVVVTASRAVLITDFRYIEAAKASKAAGIFEIVTPDKRHSAVVAEIVKDCSGKVVAVEEAKISLSGYEAFKAALEGCEVKGGASAIIDGLREFKDAEEIASTARAQDIADAAFKHIIEFIKPDMTEIDVALELEFFMRAHGAESTAFDTIAVSGKASSLPHGEPRNVQLEKGFLTMDYGAKIDGYCSDMTRTIVIGKADDEMKRLYNTVLEAQLAALAAAKPGALCREMDKIARDIIDNAGYKGAFGHSLGHGVGMYIHEAPGLSQKVMPADRKLTPGHIVTFEPGIYLEGKYGCRIEDMVAVLEDGILNFTHSPKELIEIY